MGSKRQYVSFLAAALLCFCVLALPVSAQADPPEDDVIIHTGEPTQPPQESAPKPTKPAAPPSTKPPETSAPTEPVLIQPVEPFTEGNAIAKGMKYHADTRKQFITIETRSGEIFYIIIDYDAPVDERNEQFSTYFLNKVDDSDLQALLEDGNSVEVCGCIDKCYAGHVNTTCPICAKDMTQCVGREPETQPLPTIEETQPEQEPEKKSPSGAILAVLLMAALAGTMGWYFLKNKLPDSQTKGHTDLDDYDYGMDDEYEEFDICDDKEEETT